MRLAELEPRLRAAWCAETSVEPNWSPDNPALGQCAVTALVVQDNLGGELIRTTVGGISHYFNRLPDGREVDLTREQFQRWDPTPPEHRERDYVLSFPATAERYQLLRAALTEEPTP